MNRRIITICAVLALAFTAVGIQASWFSKKQDAQPAAQAVDQNQAQNTNESAAQNEASPAHADRLKQFKEALSKRNAIGGYGAAAALQAPAEPVNIDDLSYGIGFTMGQNFNTQKMEINPDQLIEGFKQGFSGKEGKFTNEQVRSMLMNYQRQMMQKRMEERTKQAEVNKKEGEAFLAANKAKDGVVTLPSGLQYRVIQKGSGDKPAKEDTVSVTYTGRFINGEEFSASADPAKPAKFRVSGVIPAWQEALPLMSQGAEWELYVPAELGYGARGAGAKIAPNATLIFKIKLLEITKSADKEDAEKQETQSSSAIDRASKNS